LFYAPSVERSDTIVSGGRCMHNGEDDSDEKPTRSQDLIETVAPPRARRATEKAGALRGVVEEEPDIDPDAPALGLEDEATESSLSPDEIPTERPPWTDPVESQERLVEGVPAPPVKKNA
jgi:hypothetical protein